MMRFTEESCLLSRNTWLVVLPLQGQKRKQFSAARFVGTGDLARTLVVAGHLGLRHARAWTLGGSLPTRHSTNDGCCGTALRLHAQKAKEGGPDRGSVFHLLPFDLPSDPFPFLFYSFSTHFLLLFYSFLLLSYSFVGG